MKVFSGKPIQPIFLISKDCHADHSICCCTAWSDAYHATGAPSLQGEAMPMSHNGGPMTTLQSSIAPDFGAPDMGGHGRRVRIILNNSITIINNYCDPDTARRITNFAYVQPVKQEFSFNQSDPYASLQSMQGAQHLTPYGEPATGKRSRSVLIFTCFLIQNP